MGNAYRGWGTRLVFICIVFVIVSQKHVGGGNLTTSCSKQERLALLEFKHSVTDENGMLSSWGVGNDCCRWERVNCDDATGTVVSLHLRAYVRTYHLYQDKYYYLYGGEVNSCLRKLVNLEHLDLSGNHFNLSQIPNFIGSLKQLRYLNLSNAGFYGDIPHQIGNLSNLKVLDLSSPPLGLTTNDMAWVYRLSKLEHLRLAGVDLVTTQNLGNLLYTFPFLLKLCLSGCGLFSDQFRSHHLNSSREHSSITHLDLGDNSIEGRIPSVLANMSSLLSLTLSQNLLNSSISFMPKLLKLNISQNNFRQIEDVGIWSQCHLKELIVSGNILEGEIISPSTNVSKCSQNALEVLHLDGNKFNCSIPEALGILNNLRSLDISFNKLTGPIPEGLGKLRSLQGLYLPHNQLNNTIPESLGGLTGLTEMFLNSNQFRGPIPTSLGRLTSLSLLLMSSNLLNETLPNSIGKLTKLRLLSVSNNLFQGVVSENLFANLSMLKYFYASSNNKLLFNFLREWIPPFQLKVVQLSSCKIESGFPQWIQTQRRLEELVLSNTSISGPLPTWLHLMPIMRVLDLSHNKLDGPLIGNLPSIYETKYKIGGILYLKDNLFTGIIPRELCAWKDLQILDISKNMLTGKIPLCLWKMSLYEMLLGSNRLSGVIPSSLGPVHSPLAFIQLSDNNLSGELPRDVGYFISVQVLDLGENKISGNIPEWVGEKMERLTALRLHKNNFTSRIPQSLCGSQELQILDLAHNNLKGTIPHCLGDIPAMMDAGYESSTDSGYEYMMQVLKGSILEYTSTLKFVRNIDLSSNKLVGEIPKELTTLILVGLNLSYNQLSGEIPKGIGNMTFLTSLDLSVNRLTGMIPPSIASLNFLSYLNLSHNNLSGQIPKGNQLQTLPDPCIYAYNPYLSGAPLPKECSPHENPPTTTSKKQYENGKGPNKVWFYLDILSGFATGFWGIIGVLLFKKQWRHNFFMFFEETMDKIYVAVTIRVLKMKRGCNIIK